MTGRTTRFVLVSATVLALAALGYGCSGERQPATVTLRFTPVVDGVPLTFNQFLYPNPGGDGEFKIRDFQFFISNIKLFDDIEVYREPASYHLARFDVEDGVYNVILESVPRRNFRTIELSVGVDSIRNGSIDAVGDLDPNGRMAWSWDVGYKFILFEGGLQRHDTQHPLVYHVGFDENYKSVRFDLAQSLSPSSATIVDFQVDVMKLFKGASTIDMAALSDVKFDRADARRIAANYERMISLRGLASGT